MRKLLVSVVLVLSTTGAMGDEVWDRIRAKSDRDNAEAAERNRQYDARNAAYAAELARLEAHRDAVRIADELRRSHLKELGGY